MVWQILADVAEHPVPASAPGGELTDRPGGGVLAEAKLLGRKRIEQARKRRADKRAASLEKKAGRIKRWVHLTVPVTEGQQFRLGRITISGVVTNTSDQMPFEGNSISPTFCTAWPGPVCEITLSKICLMAP